MRDDDYVGDGRWETAQSIIELFVAILSIVALTLHYRQSKHINRAALFHAFHCMYCVWTIAISTHIFLHAFKIVNTYPMGMKNLDSCSALKKVTLWFTPQSLLWLLTIYNFFVYFDAIFIKRYRFSRRANIRLATYIIYSATIAVFSITYWAREFPTTKDCLNEASNLMVTQIVLIRSTTLVEMVSLTWNIWNVCYKNKKLKNIAGKTHIKFIGCVINVMSVFSGIVVGMTMVGALKSAKYITYNYKVFLFNFLSSSTPSYFTLYLLWDRHYLRARKLNEQVDDDDDDDDNNVGEKDIESGTTDSFVKRETELRPFSAFSRSMVLRDEEARMSDNFFDSNAARDIQRGIEYVLPHTSIFNIHALLNAPKGLFIEEDLRPPQCTGKIVQLFLKNIAIPTAEVIKQQLKNDTMKLLRNYGSKSLEDGTSDGTSDGIHLRERQARFITMKQKNEELNQEAEEWLFMLQSMMKTLPTKGMITREDMGTHEGWRPFKRSSAKKMLGVAMWPTNLQLMNAVVKLPEQKTLVLSMATYGAPCAHAIGFQRGSWRESEEKVFQASQASNSGPQERKTSNTTSTANEDIDGLVTKFYLSTRSCVSMSQALAAAVASAVNVLELCVAQEDGMVIRQWVSIGMLMHEVSLLSTFGQEMRMIGDMSMALQYLNLRLKLVRSRASQKDAGELPRKETFFDNAASPREGNFHVEALENAEEDWHVNVSEITAHMSGKKTVTLAVSSEIFTWLTKQIGASEAPSDVGAPGGESLFIEVHPVLMTLGINEMQTVANARGDTSLQTNINRQGLQSLRRYFDDFCKFLEGEQRAEMPSEISRHTFVSCVDSDHAIKSACKDVLVSLEGLIEVEASLKERKTIDLLVQSCFAARLLNGCRTLSCKSAKDRTSMFYTLELVRLAEKRGLLSSLSAKCKMRRGEPARLGTVQNVLNMLRSSNGVRLQNCKDNIGKAAYSFSNVQVQALPRELQPPLWTISGAGKYS